MDFALGTAEKGLAYFLIFAAPAGWLLSQIGLARRRVRLAQVFSAWIVGALMLAFAETHSPREAASVSRDQVSQPVIPHAAPTTTGIAAPIISVPDVIPSAWRNAKGGPDSASQITIQTADLPQAVAKPWPGPRWKHARRRTPLDHVFQPTQAGRDALNSALAGLEIASLQGLECADRTQNWAAAVSHHVREVMEDRETTLGDPLGFTHAVAERQAFINDAVERVQGGSKPSADMLCDGFDAKTDLADADEIARRPLLRHHEEWEGVGGH